MNLLDQMTIHIRVVNVEYDAEQCALRVNGRNVEESEYIKVTMLWNDIERDFDLLCNSFQMGQFHTVEVEMNQPVTITKEHWDAVDLARLDDASSAEKKAEVAVIVMQEGLAHVCLVTSVTTITKARIERSIPRKSVVSEFRSS